MTCGDIVYFGHTGFTYNPIMPTACHVVVSIGETRRNNIISDSGGTVGAIGLTLATCLLSPSPAPSLYLLPLPPSPSLCSLTLFLPIQIVPFVDESSFMCYSYELLGLEYDTTHLTAYQSLLLSFQVRYDRGWGIGSGA